MNYLRWFVFMLMLLICSGGHSTEELQSYAMGGFVGTDGGELSKAFRLEGVAGFMEGRASSALMGGIRENAHDWVSSAMVDVANGWRDEFRGHGEYRNRVGVALKKRIKEWLPGEVKKIVGKGLGGELPGGEITEQAARISDRVWREMDRTIDGHVDRLSGMMMSEIERGLRERYGGSGWGQLIGMIDPRNPAASIGRIFDVGNIAGIAAREISAGIGSATVDEIRGRIMNAFDGKLPPEAMHALQRGPQEFEKYVSEMQKYMPGRQFGELKELLLGRPLFKIPSTAYAAILSATAARHYASAFKGVSVDFYELDRAIDVTKVMIWQVREKENVSIDVMDIANLSRDFGRLIGAGEFVGRIEGEIVGRLERLEALTARLDGMIMNRVSEVRSRINGVVGDIQEELTAVQEALVSPVRDLVDGVADDIQDGLDGLGRSIADALPDISDEVAGALEGFGLPEGWGDRRATDLLDGVGESLTAVVADATVSVADSFGKLGPLARILDVEKIPENHESISGELDPVFMHNGEYIAEVTDFVIPGRGLDIKFTRIYRARSFFRGELGWRWTHSYAERLLPWNDGVSDGLTHIDERGRKFFFSSDGDLFKNSAGTGSTITRTYTGFEMKAGGGGVTSFGGDGRMLSKRDRFGNRIELIYGGDGLLSAIVDTLGRKIGIDRGADGMIGQLVDFAGRHFRYEYDERGDLIGAISPATNDHPKGRTTAYRYTRDELCPDRDHLLKMAMDPRGNIFLRNKYDEEGRVSSQQVGDGKWMKVEYLRDKMGRMRTWVADSLGVTRLYEHDARGRLTEENLLGEGENVLIEKNNYSADGGRVSKCGPSGRCNIENMDDDSMVLEAKPSGNGPSRITRIKMDGGFGRISYSMEPDGSETRFDYTVDGGDEVAVEMRRLEAGGAWAEVGRRRYNSLGQLASEVGSDGLQTKYEYHPYYDPDGDGVILMKKVDREITTGGYLKSIESGGERRSFIYDPIGNIVRVTRSDGLVTHYDVDNANRVIGERNSAFKRMNYAFDKNDNLIAMLSDGVRFEYVYDDEDRLISQASMDASGSKLSEHRYGYDDLGNVSKMVRGQGGEVMFDYNGQGQLIREKNSGGELREWSYGGDGDLVAIRDGSGTTHADRNGFGEIVGMTSSGGKARSYVRDASGDIIASVDASGKSSFYIKGVDGRAEDVMGGEGVASLEKSLREYNERAIYPGFAHTSFHRGQGGASSASIPNRPLVVSKDYGVHPFNRSAVADMSFPAEHPRMLPRLTCLRFEGETIDAIRSEVAAMGGSGGDE
jgi:YD repeat-containing protein